MTTVIGSGNCGNSPKNRLLEELTIAVGSANLSEIRVRVTDSISWIRVGQDSAIGADAVCSLLESCDPADELTIFHVISHGRAGAVNGSARYGAHEEAFCHVFEFNNAKGKLVQAMTTYIVRQD